MTYKIVLKDPKELQPAAYNPRYISEPEMAVRIRPSRSKKSPYITLRCQ